MASGQEKNSGIRVNRIHPQESMKPQNKTAICPVVGDIFQSVPKRWWSILSHFAPVTKKTKLKLKRVVLIFKLRMVEVNFVVAFLLFLNVSRSLS